MIVYWCGTEDVDFSSSGFFSGSANDGAGSYDGTRVREALGTSANGTSWPLTGASWLTNPTSFGARSSFWLHFSQYNDSGNAMTSGCIMTALADSGGVARLLVRATGTAGQVKISTRNAAGTITDLTGAVTASGAIPSSPKLNKIDIFVNYSISGQVQLYVNGALAADTGAGVNVTTDSATSLSFFWLTSPSTSGNHWDYSQVIVADSDTRNTNLWLMNSATAGNAQTWTGTASSVNKTTISDATFISAASAGLIEEFKTGGIALPSGSFSVAAVKMSSRALGGSGGGPTRVEYVTRIGSTDYVGGTWTPPTGGFANDTQNYIQATNPATGLPWTTSDLTAATFNYGIESVA